MVQGTQPEEIRQQQRTKTMTFVERSDDGVCFDHVPNQYSRGVCVEVFLMRRFGESLVR